jgi:phytoene dehydrogenase-like protein
LRVPSLADPSLAPPGKAVMTATIGAVPSKLFDGPWTKERHGVLAAMALAAAEKAAPGCGTKVLTHAVITAPDIEAALGLTEGDLDGGELTPDQALGFRPFPDWGMPRTPVPGVYLAGPSAPSSAFFTGLSGARAAAAIIADLGK